MTNLFFVLVRRPQVGAGEATTAADEHPADAEEPPPAPAEKPEELPVPDY